MKKKSENPIFSTRLPSGTELQYREDQLKNINKLVRQGTILLSIAIWIGFAMGAITTKLSMDNTLRITLYLQLVFALGFGSSFVQGALRLSIIRLTPVYYGVVAFIYMTEVVHNLEIQYRPGTHAIIIFIVLIPYITEKIFLSVAVASGVVVSAIYLLQTVSVGFQVVELSQQLFHLLLANGLGVFTCNLVMKTTRDRYWAEKNSESDRDRMEVLLHRILPASIAKRMNAGENEIAEHYAEVTVAFIDIVGFTKIASDTSADSVVGMLGGIFSNFDKRADQFGVEKIKTIGDAYMAVCGCPTPNLDHTKAVVNFSLACMRDLHELAKDSGFALSMRVGISTGPIVGGVLESRRMGFDIWGDTVNIASRMETSAFPDEILMSKESYLVVKHEFLFGPERVVDIKGKGLMSVYPLTWHQVRECA